MSMGLSRKVIGEVEGVRGAEGRVGGAVPVAGPRWRVRAAQRAQRSKDGRERAAGLLLVLVFLSQRRDRGREPRLQSFQRVSAHAK